MMPVSYPVRSEAEDGPRAVDMRRPSISSAAGVLASSARRLSKTTRGSSRTWQKSQSLEFLITLKKAQRMERTWLEVFRKEALPLIDEEWFALLYSEGGVERTNRAVETVLVVLALKAMFDLTDTEGLEFNLLRQHARDYAQCSIRGRLSGESGS